LRLPLLLAIAMGVSVGQASVSDVSVLGNGSLTTSGSAWLVGDTSIDGAWVDVLVDDPADAVPTVDSASASQSWVVLGWLYGSYTTTISANLTVDELLDTDIAGDLASDDVTLKLELFADNGSLLDSDVFSLANSVADGAELGPLSTPVLLAVTTPESAADAGYVNNGTLKLTVEGEASAYTHVIPAPGAIVLASLGMGLVGWLRTRKTL
jgi:hypothetical protein